MNRKIFLLAGLLTLFGSLYAETVLSVVPLYGNEQNYAVSLIGKITFQDKTMYLSDKSNQVLGWTNVDDIRKITFSANTQTTLSEVTNGNGVVIFPNPTQDRLIIMGMQDEQSARIFSLHGALILIGQMNSFVNEIDVSNLPKGTYLLQVGAEILKFIKE